MTIEDDIRARRAKGATPRQSDVDYLLAQVDELKRVNRLRLAEHSAFALVWAWCIPDPQYPRAEQALEEASKIFANDERGEKFAAYLDTL